MANEVPLPRPAKWAAVFAAVAAGFGLLMLPAAWALRGRSPVALDGIATLDDAVAACRRSGLAAGNW